MRPVAGAAWSNAARVLLTNASFASSGNHSVTLLRPPLRFSIVQLLPTAVVQINEARGS